MASLIPTSTNYDSVVGSTVDPQQQQVLELRSRRRKYGVLTGCLYMILIVCGITAEVGIRGAYIDWSDVRQTAENIRNNIVHYRMSIVLDLTMSCIDVVISILLFILLTDSVTQQADQQKLYRHVMTAGTVTFRLIQQAVLATNLINSLAASLLFDSKLTNLESIVQQITVFSSSNNNGNNNGDDSMVDDAVEVLAFMFLTMHKYGYMIALVFFGISLVLLGALTFTQENGLLFPRWLGFWILLGGICYILDTAFHFFVVEYDDSTASNLIMMPVLIAEFGITLYLLIREPIL